MVHTLDNKRNSTYKVKSQGNEYTGMLGILHQNITRIKEKFREHLLHTKLKNIDIHIMFHPLTQRCINSRNQVGQATNFLQRSLIPVGLNREGASCQCSGTQDLEVAHRFL
jgi:hypothetical protein